MMKNKCYALLITIICQIYCVWHFLFDFFSPPFKEMCLFQLKHRSQGQRINLTLIGQTTLNCYKENKEMTLLKLYVTPPTSQFERDTVMFSWQLDIQIHPSHGKKLFWLVQGLKWYSLKVSGWFFFLTGYIHLHRQSEVCQVWESRSEEKKA